MTRQTLKRFALAGCAIAWLAATATASAQTSQAIEKLVNVGQYNLNFRIVSGNETTILLESGGGGSSADWGTLLDRIARETGATVVAYDRAGFGKSDLPDTKFDIVQETGWMWQALKQLGLDRRVILVGHSFGGVMIRLESSQHPEAVKGLVFVDPFTWELVDALGLQYCLNHPMMGKLPFDVSRPETLTRRQRAMVRFSGAPGNNLPEWCAVVRRVSVPKGIPVRVITSGRTDWLPKPEEHKYWRESHERLTASIKGAKLVVADESDHMVPRRQPDLFVSVVGEVLKLAK